MKKEIIDLVFWRENIFNSIRDISDIEYQKKVWLNNSIPEIVDSFDESYMRLLDDNNLKEFCEDYKLLFGENHFYKLLVEFYNKYIFYVESSLKFNLNGYINLNDFVIWDKNWLYVVECAKLVINNWDYKNLKILTALSPM